LHRVGGNELQRLLLCFEVATDTVANRDGQEHGAGNDCSNRQKHRGPEVIKALGRENDAVANKVGLPVSWKTRQEVQVDTLCADADANQQTTSHWQTDRQRGTERERRKDTHLISTKVKVECASQSTVG
jgi:hypothetical protein